MGLFDKIKTENSKFRTLKYSDFNTKLLVETPLPGVTEEPNALSLPGGNGPVTDFFRGGVGQGKARVDDVVRLTKYFTTTSGILFTAKQEALSNLGVRTQAGGTLNDGIYLPTSTIAQAAVNNLGIFLNKQGSDPTGLTPSLSRPTYFSIENRQFISNVNTNRLVLLTDKILGVGRTFPKKTTVSDNPYVLLTYQGGPNGAGGIGKTNISYLTDQKTSGWNPRFGDYINLSEELPQATFFDSNQYFEKNPGYLKFNTVDNQRILINGIGAGRNSILSKYGFSEGLPGFENNYANLYEELDNLNVSNKSINYPLGYGSPNKPSNASKEYKEINSGVLGISGSINYNKTTSGISSYYSSSKSSYGIDKLENNDIADEGDLLRTNKIYVDDPNNPNSLRIDNNSNVIYNNNTLTYNIAQMQAASDEFYGDHETFGSGGSLNGVIPPYRVKLVDFRRNLYNQLPNDPNNTSVKYSSVMSAAPNYAASGSSIGRNIEERVNLGSPGDTRYNRFSPSTGIDYNLYNRPNTPNALDTINAYPLYRAKNVDGATTSPGGGLNDLCKFRIAAIDGDDPEYKVFMHFRAFLESFSDTYTPEWNSQKFVGRGDSLYTYGGFTRTVSLSWTVQASSIQELLPMYRKLNYLASNTMPDYSSKGYMRAPLIELTVGGYLFDQPGFISNLSFETLMDAGWEIGINDRGTDSNPVEVYELPKALKVTMGFTPIPEFLPGKVQGELVGLNQSFKTNKHRQDNFNKTPAWTTGFQGGLQSDKNYLVNQYKNYIALTDAGVTFDNY